MLKKRVRVEKRGKLSETIMSEIMDTIIADREGTMEYLPSEAELTEIYDVSRTTIREAVKGLEERGFVKRQQGKGIKVINNSIEVVSNSLHAMIMRDEFGPFELLEVRRIIETQTAYLAAKRATEEDLQEFKQAIEVMNSTVSDEEYILHDLKFHILIAKASGNKILESIMRALATSLKEEIYFTTLGSNFQSERNSKLHQRIFEKIAQKDAEGAEQYMREHLVRTEKMLVNHLNKMNQ